jgi:hypothetical protein
MYKDIYPITIGPRNVPQIYMVNKFGIILGVLVVHLKNDGFYYCYPSKRAPIGYHMDNLGEQTSKNAIYIISVLWTCYAR